MNKVQQLALAAKQNSTRLLAVVSGSALTVPAFAAIDSADILTEVTAATAVVVAVGTAILLLHYAAKAFGWVKKAG